MGGEAVSSRTNAAFLINCRPFDARIIGNSGLRMSHSRDLRYDFQSRFVLFAARI